MKHDVVEHSISPVKAWYVSGNIYLKMSDDKEVSFPVELNRKHREAKDI